MPLYDFECECGARKINVEFGMNDKKIVKCPSCEVDMIRVWNRIPTIIKTTLASSGIKLGPNQAFANVDGQPVRMNFIDHGERGDTEPGGIARKMGARMDAKTGRPVVDVVSNIPNPLAAMAKARARGDAHVTKKLIRTPYKRR